MISDFDISRIIYYCVSCTYEVGFLIKVVEAWTFPNYC